MNYWTHEYAENCGRCSPRCGQLITTLTAPPRHHHTTDLTRCHLFASAAQHNYDIYKPSNPFIRFCPTPPIPAIRRRPEFVMLPRDTPAPLAILVSTISIVVAIAVSQPFSNIIVKFRADYTPKRVQLHEEDNAGASPSANGVSSIFEMAKRVYKIEVWVLGARCSIIGYLTSSWRRV